MDRLVSGDHMCFVLRPEASELISPSGRSWTLFEAGWSRVRPDFSRAFARKLSCSPGPLAHPEEQGTFNPKVPGSRPRAAHHQSVLVRVHPTQSPTSVAVGREPTFP